MSLRPSRIVGICAILALAWITFNTITTDAPGGKGVAAGAALPPFAAPLAPARLEGDASVALQARDGHPAACAIRGADILNSCQLAQRGPVAIAFFITRSGRCGDAVDELDALRPRFPGIGFAAVAIRGSRDDVRAEIRERGWGLPVAWDRDGAVANAYAVSVCPTITLARRGGRVEATLLGVQPRAELERRLARLSGSASP
ncbi:MAG: hypothetical protein QOF17_930 [Solirubrobacteraceae bacterium]|nr:hypothetical protein [Solirubrobacteraceae bacterium]